MKLEAAIHFSPNYFLGWEKGGRSEAGVHSGAQAAAKGAQLQGDTAGKKLVSLGCYGETIHQPDHLVITVPGDKLGRKKVKLVLIKSKVTSFRRNETCPGRHLPVLAEGQPICDHQSINPAFPLPSFPSLQPRLAGETQQKNPKVFSDPEC